jgi:hypothetical protein
MISCLISSRKALFVLCADFPLMEAALLWTGESSKKKPSGLGEPAAGANGGFGIFAVVGNRYRWACSRTFEGIK